MKQRAGNYARQTQIGRLRQRSFAERHPLITFGGGWLGMALFALVINILFWGALIWGTLALLNHYGVI